MGGGFLHVAERYPGVQRCGDERVPERMGTDGLINPRAAGDPPDDPCRTVPVQPPAIIGQEDRSFAALADGQVNRPRGPRGASGMVTTLPPLRVITRVR